MPHSITLSLFEEGILISNQVKTHLFALFNEDPTVNTHQKIVKAPLEYLKKHPIFTASFPLLVGLLKFQCGFLIVVSKTAPAVFVVNLEIHKVTETVLVPLDLLEARKFFMLKTGAITQEVGEASADDEVDPQDAAESVEGADIDDAVEDLDVANDNIDLETVKTPIQIPQVNNPSNILFTKVGILSQTFKSSPLLGLNSYNSLSSTVSNENLGSESDKQSLVSGPGDLRRPMTFNENEQVSSYPMVKDYESIKHHDSHYVSPKFVKKFLSNITRFFSKGGFYFSYDHNIIDRLQFVDGEFQPWCKTKTLSDLNSDFFWNKDIISSFCKVLDADDEMLLMPLIQGFVGSIQVEDLNKEELDDSSGTSESKSELKIPTLDSNNSNSFNSSIFNSSYLRNQLFNATNFKNFTKQLNFSAPSNPSKKESLSSTKSGTILLISKRSNKRCGVRYLRRGIDDDANVANFIETTQYFIVDHLKIFTAFDIIRGSIPVFFEQDPTKLQPTPKPSRSSEQSEQALIKHFQRLQKSYGSVTTVSLVEKHKREQTLGQLFEHLMVENGFKFVWFDFHDMCKKMKFENVKLLLDEPVENDLVTVRDQLDLYKWTDPVNNIEQSGVFRINCVDCLDRTNIVCKFLSEQILQRQISGHGLVMEDEAFNYKFSDLWANNGDSISQQYCSTNAMKGDFTRTNKRNYKGLFNDAILSLTRYYYNSITDFFNQFVIDYLLYHNDNDSNFVENFESLFENFDPNLDNTVALQRQLVMANVTKLFGPEDILGSWWVKSSFELNMTLEVALVDCIFILTKTHLCLIDADISSNKIQYYKIGIESVCKLQYGHFFSSAYTSNDKNPKKNVGMKVEFGAFQRKVGDFEKDDAEDATDSDAVEVDEGKPKTVVSNESESLQTTHFITVKFDPTQLTYNDSKLLIKLISNVCFHCELVKKDIVTFEEAKKSSSILKNIDYRVKRLVWG